MIVHLNPVAIDGVEMTVEALLVQAEAVAAQGLLPGPPPGAEGRRKEKTQSLV